MKKSKSASSKKSKRKSPDSNKSKRARNRSRSSERKKTRVEKALPRKTRWDSEKTTESLKKASPMRGVEKKEKSSPDPPSQIKDLLNDKERLIEHLFVAITGTALQELIPDYLKKRTTEELKKLCLEQLQQMSSDFILHVLSGKDTSEYPKSENKDSEITPVEEESSVKSDEKEQQTEIQQKSEKVQPVDTKGFPVSSNPDASENSSDVLELFATSNEMEGIIDDENQVPLVVEEEVARELRMPESDAEILELEMRARAIRSLLKSRSRSLPSIDQSEPKP